MFFLEWIRERVKIEYVDSSLEFCGDREIAGDVYSVRENTHTHTQTGKDRAIEYMFMIRREKEVFEDAKGKIIPVHKPL